MIFHFVCPASLEPWDHSRPDGIAGSETCVIELSRRLAARGHDVRVYAHTFEDTVDDPVSGVPWRNIRTTAIELDEPGIWWLCRHPPLVDLFPADHPHQRIFLRCDDLHYGTSGPPNANALTPARAQKLDHVLLMSEAHREFFLQVYKFLPKEKTSTLGCGIAVDRMDQANEVWYSEGGLPQRDPFRLVWVSSPDRGLDTMLDIFQRARLVEPRLWLHIYYGWNGCEHGSGGDPDHPLMKLKRRCTEELDQTHVYWRGRVGKEVLWRAHLSSNLWVYPTTFFECGVVSAQEAQALGTIPVCPPYGGLKSMVKNGVFIAGDPHDPVIRDRYVDTILRLVSSPGLCANIRTGMMPWARQTYDWERVVDHHEDLAGCLRPWLIRTTLETVSAGAFEDIARPDDAPVPMPRSWGRSEEPCDAPAPSSSANGTASEDRELLISSQGR